MAGPHYLRMLRGISRYLPQYLSNGLDPKHQVDFDKEQILGGKRSVPPSLPFRTRTLSTLSAIHDCSSAIDCCKVGSMARSISGWRSGLVTWSLLIFGATYLPHQSVPLNLSHSTKQLETAVLPPFYKYMEGPSWLSSMLADVIWGLEGARDSWWLRSTRIKG